MMNKKQRSKINNELKIVSLSLILIILIIIGMNFVSAKQITANITLEQNAADCFKESQGILTEMQNNGFSVQRINDSLKLIENLYNSQLTLKEKNKSSDFIIIIPYCEEIQKIKENAFNSKDSITALKQFYKESLESGMNTSSVDVLIAEAETELKNERYEKIPALADKSYNEITNIKSNYNALNLFYETTTRSLKKFVYENKYWIISSIIILILLFLIFRQTISKAILNRKIKELEFRKKTLKDMIMNVQKSYFGKGSISEGEFNIKTKKIAELIRDIDRQIPLLQEELAKFYWKKTKKEDKPAKIKRRKK